jgi:serine protease Do
MLLGRPARWAVLVLTVAGLAVLPAAPAAAKPAVTPAERAAAIAAPAMVNLEVTWVGWVRNKATGALVDDQSVTVTTHCGGFGVSTDGYLVTAGQCVDLASVYTLFFQKIADRRVAQGAATVEQIPLVLADLLINGTVVGQPLDTPPARTVTVRREVTPDDTLPATVVSIAQPTTGDIALLKVEKQNQPLVRLADPADVVAGLELVTVEYPEGSNRPTARAGSIARTNPALIANAGPSDGIPGAPALTVSGGEVAGVVSLHQSSLATDLLAPVSAIAAELEKNKVHNDLAPIDQHYRAGLDAYYDGRYTDAVESFDAVLAIVPSHVQAHAFRDKAQGLREAEGADRSPDVSLLSVVKGWLGGAIGSLAAAAVIAGLGLVLVRRRHGHPPAAAGTGRKRLATPTYCPNCSNALPDGAADCPLCGQPAPTPSA